MWEGQENKGFVVFSNAKNHLAIRDKGSESLNEGHTEGTAFSTVMCVSCSSSRQPKYQLEFQPLRFKFSFPVTHKGDQEGSWLLTLAQGSPAITTIWAAKRQMEDFPPVVSPFL